jgi:hypothetical protein
MDSVSDTDIMAKHNLSSEELMQIHAITRAVLNEVVTDGMFSKGKRIVESTVHQALVSRAKNALNTAEKDLVKAEELVDKRKAALKNAEANHDDVKDKHENESNSEILEAKIAKTHKNEKHERAAKDRGMGKK